MKMSTPPGPKRVILPAVTVLGACILVIGCSSSTESVKNAPGEVLSSKTQKNVGVILDLTDGKLSDKAVSAIYRVNRAGGYSGFLGKLVQDWEKEKPADTWTVLPAVASSNSFMDQVKPIALESLSDVSGIEGYKMRESVKRRIAKFVTMTGTVDSGSQIVRAISSLTAGSPRPTEIWIVSDLVEQDPGLGVNFAQVLATPDSFNAASHAKFVKQLSSAINKLNISLKGIDLHLLFNAPQSSTNLGRKEGDVSRFGMTLTKIWAQALYGSNASSVDILVAVDDNGS